jgi:2-oxoglutarate dehydrogenase E2 component (dihydrolipoamide succinyltransferase)
MPTDVIMPQMGESIFEGTITKWLKRAGDPVEKDEPLFEISTDKVDAEIPSPVAGILSEVRAEEGATVQVNTVVAVIEDAGSASAPAPTTEPEEPAASAAPEPATAASDSQSSNKKIHSSPLVRRIAQDNNIDLDRVAGTGPQGRIKKEDILHHLSQQEARNAPSAAPPVAEAPTTKPASAAAPPEQAAVPPEVRPSDWTTSAIPPLPGALVPLTKMRAIIAQRMAESAQISPHVHTVFKVDMTRIVRIREREKGKYEQRNGVKLTYMPFIGIAVVETLRKFPIVNASLESGSIRYHENINLGIAVALEWGLIVPVVKQAEERSFLGMARAIVDLAERARAKRLKPEEASGSTFTLTNSGIFGEESGTPIINQPEAAILAIGGLKKEPVIVTDAEGNDTIAIRSVQNFCLGFDHRIIDGADAGKFMSEFKKTLESWDREIG